MTSKHIAPLSDFEYCQYSGRSFVKVDAIPLDWYDHILNREGVGSLLDAATVIFSREETAWLQEENYLQFDAGDGISHLQKSSVENGNIANASVNGVLSSVMPGNSSSSSSSKVKLIDELSQGHSITFDEGLSSCLVRAYKLLKKQGYTVRSGLKMGADFLVYKGQQGQTHAEYAVVCHDPDEPSCDVDLNDMGDPGVEVCRGRMTSTSSKRPRPSEDVKSCTSSTRKHGKKSNLTWADVAAKSRLCTSVGKKLIIFNGRTGKGYLVKRWKI
ncbi:unnamed protein product [Amoebophrya sp. A25]|nr:unnamed protein product [Amoebophrya sp. A25]|eukprot:GSA25T00024293001.1